jgi:hypothetical protein
MKYYSIHFTLNPKFRGSNDYIKNYKIKIPNNKLYLEEPKFIGNINNEKIKFNPYLLDIELYETSKINDLIMDGGPVSLKLIVSDKLKTLLEKYRKTGMQYFNINIIKKNQVFDNYWILNFFETNYEVLDFQKSRFYETENIFTLKKEIEINSLTELIQVKKDIELKGYPYGFIIDKLIFNDNVVLDFFVLTNVEGGIKYITSETLKEEIEKENITGIEFRPIEILLQDWLKRDGPRDQIYGRSW